MANQPTIGVFIPTFLNASNDASDTGQADVYGNVYPSGLNKGKLIELGPTEAKNLSLPGTTLYDGAYMRVQLDSSATAANATAGMAAYIKLDSGATAGALPETAYEGAIVTTYDQVTGASAASLLAGVFLNPASLSGQSYTPTPGNWIFIFVGAGRVQVNIATATGTAIGNTVAANGSTNSGFTSNNSNAVDATTLGVAVTAPSTANGAVVYAKNIIYRLPN